MLRIVGSPSTGKTKEILTYAKNNNCIVVCAVPSRLTTKASCYGLGYIECISYDNFLAQYKDGTLEPRSYLIDELENLVSMMFQGESTFAGYDMSIE